MMRHALTDAPVRRAPAGQPHYRVHRRLQCLWVGPSSGDGAENPRRYRPTQDQCRGLDPVTAFDDISSDPTVPQHLQDVYDTAEDIDIWVGGWQKIMFMADWWGRRFSPF